MTLFEQLEQYKMNKERTEDPRNWDKPSRAVVASNGKGDGCILFHVGPHLEEEMRAVGDDLTSLGLEDCPQGIWIWEGIYQTIRVGAYDCTEYDTEPYGEFRKPTQEEWESINCPWDKNEWLKNDKELKANARGEDKQFECAGCRQGLPLGSGRYHFLGLDLMTIPCTHNPVTGEAYELQNKKEIHARDLIEHDCPSCKVNKSSGGYNCFQCVQKTVFINSVIQCDCGAQKCNTTHSSWCSTVQR